MSEINDNGVETTTIERFATGKRILLTIFFGIVLALVQSVLAYVVLFELCYALVTRRPPSERVTGFGRRLVRYAYDIAQYMTYNQEELPFPFGDFPREANSPNFHSVAAG